MIKLLPVFFAMTLGFTVMAQKKITSPVMPFRIDQQCIINYPEMDRAEPASAKVPEQLKGTSTLVPVFIGASRNIFGMIGDEQTCLWYDKDLNNILMTCRGNNFGSAGVLATGNDINNFFSGDEGSTWIGKTVLTGGGGTYLHRHPSGVFYNPAGNTNINNAYTVVAGPRSDGYSWISTFHGSAKYDLSDSSSLYTPLEMMEWVKGGMTSSSNGIFNVSGCGYSIDYSSAHLFAHHGVWNPITNEPDWGITEIDLADYVFANPASGQLTMYFGWSNGAFSKDGSVGYMFIRASDKRPAEHPSISPIIWQTTDGGISWNALDYFDFGTLPAIQEHILPSASNPDLFLPFFDNIDLVVDGMGLPHIFAAIRGCISNDPDSLWFVYVSATDHHSIDNNVFELYRDEASYWHAIWVAYIETDDVIPDVSPYHSSSGNVGWSHRIQASRTDDGSMVYATWTDTDYLSWACEKYNLHPDLKFWGRDVYSYVNTPAINVTHNDPVMGGSVFFHYTSPVIIETGGRHTIPVTFEDIKTNGFDADLPSYHYYIQGIDVETWDGLPTPLENNRSAKVTQCFPNPFTRTTSFDVTLSQRSSVCVNTSNVTGKNVLSKNYGVFPSGTHRLIIDASSLPAGVYFNEVSAGVQKFTNKMIVE